MKITGIVQQRKKWRVLIYDRRILWYIIELCLPDNIGLKGDIIREAHNAKQNIHPRATKMNQDMKNVYWWPFIKRNIT